MARRRGWSRLLGSCCVVAVTCTCCASREARAEPPVGPQAVDYDAPDPNRTVLDGARAFANMMFESYVIFQIDYFRGVIWNTVTRESIRETIQGRWDFDYDPISENLLGHPLHGLLHYTSARGAGLSFWESLPYPVVGSLIWDFTAERRLTYPGGWTSKPSINDFVTTSTAGVLLGETTYRLSSAVLDDSTHGSERFFRELLGTFLCPMRALDRVETGKMWKSGAPPERLNPVSAAIDIGVDYLQARDFDGSEKREPSGLLAVDLDYGSLRPRHGKHTLAPFEHFDGYVGFNLLNSRFSGARVYAQAWLYGWSSDTSYEDDPDRRDNNVLGFVQTFDYQGLHDIQYAALGLGPNDTMTWRLDERRFVRLGMDVTWTYLGAATTPFAPVTDHNYLMGAALGATARVDLGPAGRFGARTRSFLTSSLDGQGDEDVITYGRFSYDVDFLPHVGVGIAPTITGRRSQWNGTTVTATALDTQLYLQVHD